MCFLRISAAEASRLTVPVCGRTKTAIPVAARTVAKVTESCTTWFFALNAAGVLGPAETIHQPGQVSTLQKKYEVVTKWKQSAKGKISLACALLQVFWPLHP
ncbi:MAG TPA: hypothetical protein VKL99_01490 [Candidatus Angelobacter sp.]|nr:hypothetical protein [Candidatus Angelobacter sp.]